MLKLSQMISFFILAPLFFSVFCFCPFKLPYLYCFVCPVRCPWYWIRGIVVLLALGLNIKKDLFCNHLCPFGTLQTILDKITRRKIRIPKALASLKYIGVIVIIVLVIFTMNAEIFPQSFMGVSIGQILVTKMKSILLLMFLFAILLSIFNYRFFCFGLCPIRAISSMIDKVIPHRS